MHAGQAEVSAKKNAGHDYHKRFLNYCTQSLEYYIDADVAVFCSEERPTRASRAQLGFLITAWDVQVISTHLRRSCRLRVVRGDTRVLYEPQYPEDLEAPSQRQAPPGQGQDR